MICKPNTVSLFSVLTVFFLTHVRTLTHYIEKKMPLLFKGSFDIRCKNGKDSKFTRDTHKHNHIHFFEQKSHTANP